MKRVTSLVKCSLFCLFTFILLGVNSVNAETEPTISTGDAQGVAIRLVTLNKGAFKAGEEIYALVRWNAGDMTLPSRGGQISGMTPIINVTVTKGSTLCADPVVMTLFSGETEAYLPIKATADCVSPTVRAVLIDAEGQLVGDKVTMLAGGVEIPSEQTEGDGRGDAQVAPPVEENTFRNIGFVIAITLAALGVMAILIVLIRRRSVTKKMSAFILALGLSAIASGAYVVEAQFSIPFPPQVIVYLDNNSYNAGETITITGEDIDCYGWVSGSSFSTDIAVSLQGTRTQIVGPVDRAAVFASGDTSKCTGTKSITVPSVPVSGVYNLTVYIRKYSYMSNLGYDSGYDIPILMVGGVYDMTKSVGFYAGLWEERGGITYDGVVDGYAQYTVPITINSSAPACPPISVDPLMTSGAGHPSNPFTVNYSSAYPRGGFEPVSVGLMMGMTSSWVIGMRYMDSGNIYTYLNLPGTINCPASKNIFGNSTLSSSWSSPISLAFNGDTLNYTNNTYSLGTNSGTCSLTGTAVCGSIDIGPGSQISWSGNTLTSSSGGSISLYSCGPCVNTPPTVSFSPDSYSISGGSSTNLNWTATNATSCTASGAWSGAKAVSGMESTGILSTNQVYFISCTGPGGTSPLYMVPLTVIPVVPPTPACTGTIDTANASACSATDPLVDTNYQIVANCGASPSKCLYTCDGGYYPNTSTSCVATQCNDGIDNDGDGKIDAAQDPGCTGSTGDNDETDTPPTLTASPRTVTEGSQTTLTWDTNNGNEPLCTLTGGTIATNPLATDGGDETGSVNIPVNARTTYTVTCPTGTASITVDIIPTGFET